MFELTLGSLTKNEFVVNEW